MMLKRTILIPSRFLPELDRILTEFRSRIEHGEIPDWGQDDVDGMMVLTLERPEPKPSLKVVA